MKTVYADFMFLADLGQTATLHQRWQNCHRLYKHQCTPLPQNRQLGHISLPTGRIPSLSCAFSNRLTLKLLGH